MKKLALLFLLIAPLVMPAQVEEVTLIAGGNPFPNPADLPANASLPDPLVTMLGAPVKSRVEWEKDRAPVPGASQAPTPAS